MSYYDGVGYSDPSSFITFGGGSGDYFLHAPILSGRWVEYRIIGISMGNNAQQSSVTVTGFGPPKTLSLDGSKTLSDGAFIMGWACNVGSAASIPVYIPVLSDWERITDPQKKLYARIDTVGTNSVLITVQFRNKLLDVVPGPSHEIHPDHMEKLNQARSEKTIERLKEMGVPGYAEEGTGVTTTKGQ